MGENDQISIPSLEVPIRETNLRRGLMLFVIGY